MRRLRLTVNLKSSAHDYEFEERLHALAAEFGGPIISLNVGDPYVLVDQSGATSFKQVGHFAAAESRSVRDEDDG